MSLDHLTIESRVAKMKSWFEENPSSSEPLLNEYIIEPISEDEIIRLEQLDYYPRDMLLILKEIGNLKSWAQTGCAVIDWWKPCDMATAIKEERCVYDGIEPEIFTNSDNLLFFAWDCNAGLWFYETSSEPWHIVQWDAMYLDGGPFTPGKSEDESEDYSDAISIIEDNGGYMNWWWQEDLD